MSKKIFREFDDNFKTIFSRAEIYSFYHRKYFNLWLSKYKWINISDEQERWIMKEFFDVGQVASFIIKGTKNTEEYPKGMICFTPFATATWNLYDYPVTATLINRKGDKFIPAETQKVDEDIVVGWCQRNHKSIRSMIDIYLTKITDVEMILRTNLKTCKTPWMIAVNPESREKMRQIWENIDSDNPRLFIDIEDSDKVRPLVVGNSYIADKLYSYKCALEDELKSFLGLDNLGTQEKKEHLITSEIESNNQVTELSDDCFIIELQKFCERIKKYLGYEISVETNAPKITYMEDDEDEMDEED